MRSVLVEFLFEHIIIGFIIRPNFIGLLKHTLQIGMLFQVLTHPLQYPFNYLPRTLPLATNHLQLLNNPPGQQILPNKHQINRLSTLRTIHKAILNQIQYAVLAEGVPT